MGSQWVEDPSWGNILGGLVSGMEAAPGKALSNIHAAEVIKDQRIKRQREQQLWDQGIATGNAYEKTLPTVAPPSTMNVLGPFTGDPNDPAVTTGIPTADVQYQDPRAQAQFDANRALAVATARQAAAAGKTSEIMPMLGYGTVATAGVPQSAQERAKLEYLTTGKFPHSDESKMPVKPYIVRDDAGNVVDEGITRDFQTNAQTGKPIAPGALLGSTSSGVDNPLKDAATAQFHFFQMAKKATNPNTPLTKDEIERANILANAAFPETITTGTDPNSGATIPIRTRPGLPTAGHGKHLLDLINAWGNQTHLQPQPAVPGVTATGEPTTDPAAVAPAAAAAPAPIVPAQPGAVTVGAPLTTGNANRLRTEYANLRPVDDINQAIGSYESMLKQLPYDNQAADQALIVNAAKILDPPSVVRSAEGDQIRATGGVGDRIFGTYAGVMEGRSRLSIKQRYDLMNMVNEKMAGHVEQVRPIYERFTNIAKQSNLDPYQTLGGLPEVKQFDATKINSIRSDEVPDARRIIQTRGATPTYTPATPQQPAAAVAPQSTNPRVDEILRGGR